MSTIRTPQTSQSLDKKSKILPSSKKRVPLFCHIDQLAHLGGNQFAFSMCERWDSQTVCTLDISSLIPEYKPVIYLPIDEKRNNTITLKRLGNTLLIQQPGVTYCWDIETSQLKPKFLTGDAAGVIQSSANELVACMNSTITRVPLNKPEAALKGPVTTSFHSTLMSQYGITFTTLPTDSDVVSSESHTITDVPVTGRCMINIPEEKCFVTAHKQFLVFWDQNWQKTQSYTFNHGEIVDLLAIPESGHFILASKNKLMLVNAATGQFVGSHIKLRDKEFIVGLTHLPNQHFLLETFFDISVNKSLHLLKIVDSKLKFIETLTNNLKCFTVEENGTIDVLEKASFEILCYTYADYAYIKLQTAPGKYQLFKPFAEVFPSSVVGIIEEYVDPYADMIPDYKAAEDQAALCAAKKIKTEIPQDAIHAASNGHLMSLDYLFSAKFIDPNQVLLTGENRPFAVKHTTLLAEALANGQVGVAAKLLDEHALTSQTINQCIFEISQLNTTLFLGNALSFAIQKGLVLVVKKLLEKGADPARCIDTDKENITTPDKNGDPYVSAVVYATTCSQLVALEKTKPGIRKQIILVIQSFSKTTLSQEQQVLVNSILSDDYSAQAKSITDETEQKKEPLSIFSQDYSYNPYAQMTPNYKKTVDMKKLLELEDKIQNCALKAAHEGYLQTLKYLFKEKLANPNDCISTGQFRHMRGGSVTTLLIQAMSNKQFGVATMLLEEYSLTAKHINYTHVYYHSSEAHYLANALTFAIRAGHVDLIIRLLKHGSDLQCVHDNQKPDYLYGRVKHEPLVSADVYVAQCTELTKLEETQPGIRKQIQEVLAAHVARHSLKR